VTRVDLDQTLGLIACSQNGPTVTQKPDIGGHARYLYVITTKLVLWHAHAQRSLGNIVHIAAAELRDKEFASLEERNDGYVPREGDRFTR
jgi:hypothetical protein